ncbi:MAG: glycosyltransferase family 39 protein [Ignavibacteriales bacterium]|nr:glycosyltransferase family 39 protein [Ignavibacteriales bacterium]
MNKLNSSAKDNVILISISLFKLILLLVFAGNYGLFRDEFYYLQCSSHLAFGYVDQSPLSLLILNISTSLFGDSILGIRIFAYIASCVTVFMAGIITRELGGGRLAQITASVSVLFCGVVLGGGSYFSMNVFDVLLSTITFYYFIRLIKTDDKKLWIYIGILFGIGLQNKLTFLFLGVGFTFALLFTGLRKNYLTKELWIGAGLAVIIFLPNIIWQFANGFPTLTFIHNAALYKNKAMGLVEFFFISINELNPFNSLFLLTAFYFLFFNKEGRRFIAIGIIYITIFLIFVFNNGKPYYMGILYPVILAIGAAGAAILFQNYLREWLGYVLLIILLPFYIFTTPFAIPVLNVDAFINYSARHGVTPKNSEKSELGLLPQFFSDRFGWENLALQTSQVFKSLPKSEQNNVVIFGQNYGEAGAIDYYRKTYNLPPVVSAHNSYWFWGYPDFVDTNTVWIVIGSNKKDNREFFESVEFAASHTDKYGMPFENVDIFICRKPKMKIDEIWQKIKMFI